MKYRAIIVLFLGIIILMMSGVTYSVFTSSAGIDVKETDIAKFVFETEMTDQIHLPLTNITPGQTVTYPFSVTNEKDNILSNVTVSYTITLKTFHFIPLTLEIYKVDGNNREKILTCDETYSRNANNEIVCNSKEMLLSHERAKQDNFEIVLTYPAEYNSPIYTDLVEFIDLEISSVQQTEGVA